jgi:hypothetical protein
MKTHILTALKTSYQYLQADVVSRFYFFVFLHTRTSTNIKKVSSYLKANTTSLITKINLLTLFKCIISVYSEKYMKLINATCQQKTKLFEVKTSV